MHGARACRLNRERDLCLQPPRPRVRRLSAFLMIAIVDYGMGNLRSVEKALQKVGQAASVTADPAEIAGADRLILPGVGAFGAAMERLRAPGASGTSLATAVTDFARSGRPFLGICLGMQLLLTESDELGEHMGLDLLAGRVVRFDVSEHPDLKVPHMGWNALQFPRASPLFAGISEGAQVYFVHSYHCVPADATVTTATCNHAGPFAAALQQGNLYATQFHPEKSGDIGLHILSNFAGV